MLQKGKHFLLLYLQEFHDEINSKNADVERLTKIVAQEAKSPGRQYGRYAKNRGTKK